VAPARNLKMGTSMNHLLKKAGSDQEHEDGTKGREVGSSNDDNLHPNSSCRRNSESDFRDLSAVVVSGDSGHPAATRRVVARFHCRTRAAAEDDEERLLLLPACNQLAEEYREVRRSECARTRRPAAQEQMPELGRIVRKLE
jgi:hypothetical protein